MAHEGESIKSDYLTFDPGGMSTINWRPTGGEVSEKSILPREKKSSDNIQKPTGSSDIRIPEKSCKMLTRTPRVV